MNQIRRLLGFGPKSPQRVATDDVYPIHIFDESDTIREAILVWTLQFNDVLNPVLLQRSLKELLEIGDWRKFGGRIRLKVCLTIDCPISLR